MKCGFTSVTMYVDFSVRRTYTFFLRRCLLYEPRSLICYKTALLAVVLSQGLLNTEKNGLPQLWWWSKHTRVVCLDGDCESTSFLPTRACHDVLSGPVQGK